MFFVEKMFFSEAKLSTKKNKKKIKRKKKVLIKEYCMTTVWSKFVMVQRTKVPILRMPVSKSLPFNTSFIGLCLCFI